MLKALEALESYLQFLKDLGVEALPARKQLRRFLDLDLAVPVTSVAELHEVVKNCTKCKLHRTRTHAVPGEGPPRVKLMLVGEAPGRDEDLEGRPFVGRAGKLLDQMLTAIKIQRSEVYITNVVKCRPPGNRNPEPEEIEACLPYLAQQIKLLRPSLICTLGLIAAQSVLGHNEPLSKLRGRIHEKNGIKVVVTYHPAFLLRFPNRKREAWEDLKMLQSLYKEVGRA